MHNITTAQGRYEVIVMPILNGEDIVDLGDGMSGAVELSEGQESVRNTAAWSLHGDVSH